MLAARQQARQADDVPVDLRHGRLIGQPALFQLGLIGFLQRDRLDQLPLLLQHRQFQLGVGEGDKWLPLLHQIAWIDQDAFDAPAIDGVDIKGVVRHHLGAQRNEIIHAAALDHTDLDIAPRQMDRRGSQASRHLQGNTSHHRDSQRGQRRLAPAVPGGLLQRSVHRIAHAPYLASAVPAGKARKSVTLCTQLYIFGHSLYIFGHGKRYPADLRRRSRRADRGAPGPATARPDDRDGRVARRSADPAGPRTDRGAAARPEFHARRRRRRRRAGSARRNPA